MGYLQSNIFAFWFVLLVFFFQCKSLKRPRHLAWVVQPVQLRKRLGRHRQKHPPFVLAIHRRIGAALAESTLAKDLVLDSAELGLRFGIVDVTVVEVGKDAEAFGVFVGVDEPSKRGERCWRMVSTGRLKKPTSDSPA